MRYGWLDEASRFPRVIAPDSGAMATLDALVDWIEHERDAVRTELRTRGAILFRGFDLRSAGDFDRVVRALESTPMEYIGGNSPRQHVLGNVYTSTDYPARFHIVLHNEQSSLLRGWPDRIMFCCLVPATEAGETPIADGRRILSSLSASTRERFRAGRVRYIRNFLPPGRRSRDRAALWDHAFGSDDKRRIESICAATCSSFEWQPTGELSTTQVVDVVRPHPVTGEEVWFSNIGTFHTYCLARRNRLPVTPLPALPLRHCTFGDGTEIDHAALDEIDAALLAEEVVFRWNAGDVLLLDNVLAAHGRRPFAGARQVLTAMASD